MRPPESSGFTLLEVLIALVIIAITMTTAFQAVSSSSRSLQRIQQSTFARWVAENEMADLQLGLVTPTVGETAGEVQLAAQRWHWLRQVTVAADPALRRVKIMVTDDQATTNRQPSATLVAFVLANSQAVGDKK